MEFLHCLGTLDNVHIGTFMKWKWKDIERGERLEAIDDHERTPHGGGVLGAVVGELGVWNTFLPVFKVLLYQHPEECAKTSIDDLGLSIGLRMRGRREEELDAELVHEGLPEVAHEFYVAVGDDCSWYTV